MDTPVPKQSRLKRLFRRALFVLAALVTLGALLVAEENWRGSRAWHNYKSAMEAKGERFDGARLIPPKVPDDQNFAACPYLAHAFAGPLESPGWTNIDSYLPKSNSLPQRPNWPYGLSTDLTNWAAAFQGGAASEKMDPAQAAAIVLDHLKVCEPVLADLRAAAPRRYCRFNVPYEEWANPTKSQPAANLTMMHFDVIKGLDLVLSLRAEAELAANQSEQALEDVNLMFRLDDGLKDEPLLISQLVHYACISLLLHPVAQGLAGHRWSDAQLRALQERLGQTDLLASTVRAFYGERDILANPFRLGSIMRWLGWDRMEQLNYNRAFQEVILPRISLAGREVNPAIGHACDLAMSNYAIGPAVLQRARAIIHHRIFAAMILPAFGRAAQKAAEAQTVVDLMTVACALERYRLAETTYPEKLEALAPRFISALPHDIINGQPLKYRRTASGKFVLYSVGWNEKDDGGVIATLPPLRNLPRPQRRSKDDGRITATAKDRGQDYLQGDWVLEYPE